MLRIVRGIRTRLDSPDFRSIASMSTRLSAITSGSPRKFELQTIEPHLFALCEAEEL